MNATGYWDAADYGSTPWYNSGLKEDAPIEERDREILRSLAEKVSEIAEEPEQKTKKDLWYRHNSLEPVRPLIICDAENGWNEVIKTEMLERRNRLAKHWEMVLKKEIFWGNTLKDDKPVEKNFDISYTFHESDWGIDIEFKQNRQGGSYVWSPGLKEYSDIKTEYAHVDATTMWMVKNPEWFDVIVTPNMFGDIITDLGAMIQGGMGVAAGANINPGGVSMFEPIGGSAPKYTGKNLINPIASIAAAQMMLDFFGETEAAVSLEKAIIGTVGQLKGMSAGRMGCSTSEAGDLVIEQIG